MTVKVDAEVQKERNLELKSEGGGFPKILIGLACEAPALRTRLPGSRSAGVQPATSHWLTDYIEGSSAADQTG